MDIGNVNEAEIVQPDESTKPASSTFTVLYDTLTKFMGYEQPDSQENTVEPSTSFEQMNVLTAVIDDQGSPEMGAETPLEVGDKRRDIVSSIAEILMNGRRNVTDDLIEAIYPVAKKIEGKLHREATSVEEYCDKDSLPDRVRIVLKKEMQLPTSNSEADGSIIIPSDDSSSITRNVGPPRQHPLASGSAGQSFQWPVSHTTQAETSGPPVQAHAEMRSHQIMRPGPKIRGRSSLPHKVYTFPEHNSERNVVIGEIIRHLQTKSSNSSQNWHTAAPHLCERLEGALYRHAKNLEDYSDLTTLAQRLGRFVSLGGSKKPTQLKVVHSVESFEEPVSAGSTSARKKSPKKSVKSSNAPPAVAAVKEAGKDLLYQQQQRILMLQHASRCQLPEGACEQPHCWSMQQLWRHVTRCTQSKCPTAHCVSSRYVLSHYAKCSEPTCRMCAPARENHELEIRRNRASSAASDDSITSLERSTSSVVKGVKKRKANPPNDQAGSGSGYGYGSKENVTNYRDDSADRSGASLTKRRLSGASMGSADGSSSWRGERSGGSVHSATSATSAKSTGMGSVHSTGSGNHRRTVTPQTISSVFIPIIERILREPYAFSCFGAPVDPVKLKLHDYFDEIKHPMDLGTVLTRLREDGYIDVQALLNDVHLTFDNCKLYNGSNSQVGAIARRLQSRFNEMSRKPRMELSQLQSLSQAPINHGQGQSQKQAGFGEKASSGSSFSANARGAGTVSSSKPFTIFDQPAPGDALSISADRQPSPTPSMSSAEGGKARHARVMVTG